MTESRTQLRTFDDPPVERAQRFLELYCRLGFADALDATGATEKKTSRSSWAEGKPSEPQHLELDFGVFLKAVVREKALPELAEIIFDAEPEVARQAGVIAVSEALVPFATASCQVIAAFLGLGRGMASA